MMTNADGSVSRVKKRIQSVAVTEVLEHIAR